MKKSSFVKCITTGIIAFTVLFASCSSISVDDKSNENGFSSGSSSADNSKYGNAKFTNLSRACDVSIIEDAEVSVVGNRIEGVSVEDDLSKDSNYFKKSKDAKVVSGKGSTEITKIPVGKNHVFTVEAYKPDQQNNEKIDGMVLRAVHDINPGVNEIFISWKTTAVGNVFYEAIIKGADVSSWDPEAIAKLIKEKDDNGNTIHPSLIDAKKLAEDLINNEGKIEDLNPSDYVLNPGTIIFTVDSDGVGVVVKVTDPTSSIVNVDKEGDYKVENIAPGTWDFDLIKDNKVVYETKVTIDNNTSLIDMGKLVFETSSPLLYDENGKEISDLVINTTKPYSINLNSKTYSDSEVKVYYTLDGTEPTASSSTCNPGDSIVIDSDSIIANNGKTITIKAYAESSSAFGPSKVVTYEFTVDVKASKTPSIYGFDEFEDSVTVYVYASEGSKIYYTLDGTEPTDKSTEYSDSLVIKETSTLKVISIEDGLLSSEVVSKDFKKVVDSKNYLVTVKLGPYDVASGYDYYGYSWAAEKTWSKAISNITRGEVTFTLPKANVTETCANFLVVQVKEGTTPSWVSPDQDKGRIIGKTDDIKFIKGTLEYEAILRSYNPPTDVATPVLVYDDEKGLVSMSCETSGASIKYGIFTENTEVSVADLTNTYSEEVKVEAGNVIKAYACYEGLKDSEIETLIIYEGEYITIGTTCDVGENYAVYFAGSFNESTLNKSPWKIFVRANYDKNNKTWYAHLSTPSKSFEWKAVKALYNQKSLVTSKELGTRWWQGNKNGGAIVNNKYDITKDGKTKIITDMFWEAESQEYNSQLEGAVTQTPVITYEADLESTEMTVSMSCSTISSRIYYTLDGSTPDDTCEEYTSPISVPVGKTVTAIALTPEYEDSGIAKRTIYNGKTVNLKVYADVGIKKAVYFVGSFKESNDGKNDWAIFNRGTYIEEKDEDDNVTGYWSIQVTCPHVKVTTPASKTVASDEESDSSSESEESIEDNSEILIEPSEETIYEDTFKWKCVKADYLKDSVALQSDLTEMVWQSDVSSTERNNVYPGETTLETVKWSK